MTALEAGRDQTILFRHYRELVAPESAVARNGYTDKEAAKAIGTRYGAFLHWLHGEYVPGCFTLVAVLRQIRDGRDPLVDASLKPTEFAAMLTSWRAEYGFTQQQAAIAIGCEFAALQSWEQQEHVPQQPALAEMDTARQRECACNPRP